MAISKVRVQINGTWTNLTKNSSTGKWEGTITAPSTTSYNLSNKYYPVTVEATNSAGTVTTKTSSDATLGSSLRLVVKETIKPVITLNSPSVGAYVHNSKFPIVFTVTDEVSGSGVNPSSVTLNLDGTTLTTTGSEGMSYKAVTNGYEFTYIPQTALEEGQHVITINASDYDGNAATSVEGMYYIDINPPTLTLSSPTDGLITNKRTITVSGLTADSLEGSVTVDVYRNGDFIDNGYPDSNGEFSLDVTLVEGENIIKVVSTDASELSTEIELTVTLDTTVPDISSVTLTPNPSSTSESVKIVVEVV